MFQIVHSHDIEPGFVVGHMKPDDLLLADIAAADIEGDT